jgi:hypothetical protein
MEADAVATAANCRLRYYQVIAQVGSRVGNPVTSEPPGRVPFQAHIELLQLFLAHRDQIVERVQVVLNAQQKPAQYLQERALLSRQFEDCFFLLAAIKRDQSTLRGQLQQAHWACGFQPRVMPGIPNDMFDPADMMSRAFMLWRDTRWPGRNGRVRYAQTLFNLYLVRCLTLLNMRLWDAGPDAAAGRLAQNQLVLDQLWRTSPADQPMLVRDVRWLVPVAQSPTTDELGPYFEVAQLVADGLPEADRLEIHKASVLMAGGHLRSQLRHFNMQGTSLDDADLVLSTRRSNALDCAMTIQGLVPLLRAYEHAVDSDERARRLELAGIICQAISPDQELFVNRVELLAAYSMIEHLFTTSDHKGLVVYTPMGQRHLRLVQEYAALIGRVIAPLHGDCPHFTPVPGAYSPYGVMYGFSSNLLEHMTLKALQPDAQIRFSLEDVFTEGEAGGEKLAWVSGWRRLPHISAEVQQLYEYPQQFAEQIFVRVEQALRAGAAGDEARAGVRTGRLHIVPGEAGGTDPQLAQVPALPVRYVLSSDPQQVAGQQAQLIDQARLLHERREGEFLVSYRTAGGWAAISKDVLTEVVGAGSDARIAGLSATAAGVLRLMCPGLAINF